jgi:hypothetical protein
MGKITDDGGIAIPRRIDGFPYPERNCPHCERTMVMEATTHIMDEPAHFKAIFQCHNPECVFIDNVTHKAYIRVYYSSEYAEKMLWKMLLQYKVQGRM